MEVAQYLSFLIKISTGPRTAQASQEAEPREEGCALVRAPPRPSGACVTDGGTPGQRTDGVSEWPDMRLACSYPPGALSKETTKMGFLSTLISGLVDLTT